MWPNPQETANLVTFTEEILNGKHHFLCSAMGGHGNFIRGNKVITLAGNFDIQIKLTFPLL